MTYQEVLAAARTCSGPSCKACPVCNGKACGSIMPGPGAKGTGTVAIRNYEAWQNIDLNMDTICENKPVDTTFRFFGETYALPVFAGPVGGGESPLRGQVQRSGVQQHPGPRLRPGGHRRLHRRRHQPGCVHRRLRRHRGRGRQGHSHREALGPGHPVRQAGRSQGLRRQGVRHGHRCRRAALPEGAHAPPPVPRRWPSCGRSSSTSRCPSS